jgi:SAM-dependent methyltransferase
VLTRAVARERVKDARDNPGMRKAINVVSEPVFCLTADTDWASEHCVETFLAIARSRQIVPTVFATHRSAVLEEADAAGAVEIGVHPNFSQGSTHGSTVADVVRHVFDMYPQAATYRSHRMSDGAEIQLAMAERGIAYDSNLGLYLQPAVTPLRLASGIVRFPIFWADDSHFRLTGGDWDLEKWLPDFLSPGLKVIDVHPLNLAVNAATLAHYEAARAQTTTLDAAAAADLEYAGEGARTFLCKLLDYLLAAGYPFRTLGELFSEHTHAESGAPSSASDEGRTTRHTDDEFRAYWAMTDDERQAFMKESYRQRDATDPYATSRDVHLRELEIEAIGQCVDPDRREPMIDLGCGNGLTLIRLAQRFPHLPMTGVDFSPELIAGTKTLASGMGPDAPAPEFVCANAFEHLAGVADASVGHVVTERFVMNLPSREAQERLLREVARVLAPGGRLIMCEASSSGFDTLNDTREELGLARIPERSADNVTVIRFEDDVLESWMSETLGLELSQKMGFSEFFLVSRVVHPALVAPRGPRFDAPINAIARRLQEALQFRPGLGANTVWVFERIDHDD